MFSVKNKLKDMGCLISKIWWGGDPDVPNAISGLSLRDIYTVQYSWTPLHAEATKYGIVLFLRLFQADPNSRQFFKSFQGMNDDQLSMNFVFRAHVVNVMSALNTAISNLHQPEVVMALMNKLGDSHRRHNVKVKDFDVLKGVFVNILKNDFKMNEASQLSWTRFVDFIYLHIFVKLNADA